MERLNIIFDLESTINETPEEATTSFLAEVEEPPFLHDNAQKTIAFTKVVTPLNGVAVEYPTCSSTMELNFSRKKETGKQNHIGFNKHRTSEALYTILHTIFLQTTITNLLGCMPGK